MAMYIVVMESSFEYLSCVIKEIKINAFEIMEFIAFLTTSIK